MHISLQFWKWAYALINQCIWYWHTCACAAYRIAGNFEGENFCEFRSFVAIRKSFLCKIWGVASFGMVKASNPRKFSLRNHIFHKFMKVFSLKSFLLYGIQIGASFTQSFQLWPLFEGGDYVKVASIWKNMVLKWESCTMFNSIKSTFARIIAIAVHLWDCMQLRIIGHKKSIKAQFCFLLIFCTRGLSTSSHSVYLMSCHSLFPQSSKATNLAEHVPSWWGMATTAVLLRNAMKSVVCVQTSVPFRNAF